jgi:hypothetical protein
MGTFFFVVGHNKAQLVFYEKDPLFRVAHELANNVFVVVVRLHFSLRRRLWRQMRGRE